MDKEEQSFSNNYRQMELELINLREYKNSQIKSLQDHVAMQESIYCKLKEIMYSKFDAQGLVDTKDLVESTMKKEVELFKAKKSLEIAEFKLTKAEALNEQLKSSLKEKEDEMKKFNFLSGTSENNPQLSNNQAGYGPMNDETLKLMEELLIEIDDHKKEKEDIQKKAMEMVAEKELENIELIEQIEKIKEDNMVQINKLIKDIQELKESASMIGGKNQDILSEQRFQENDGDEQSLYEIISELEKQLESKTEQLNKLRFDLHEKEAIMLAERINYQRRADTTDSTFKKQIDSLIESNEKMMLDIYKMTSEKKELSQNLVEENKEKSLFLNQIENLKFKIQQLEIQSNEQLNHISEEKYKANIQLLNELVELKETNLEVQNKLKESEEEIKQEKKNSLSKDKEISKLKDSITVLEKELELNQGYFKKCAKEYKSLVNKMKEKESGMAEAISTDKRVNYVAGLVLENKKLKKEYKELKELYDIQINDLQQKWQLEKIKVNRLLNSKSKSSVEPRQCVRLDNSRSSLVRGVIIPTKVETVKENTSTEGRISVSKRPKIIFSEPSQNHMMLNYEELYKLEKEEKAAVISNLENLRNEYLRFKEYVELKDETYE